MWLVSERLPLPLLCSVKMRVVSVIISAAEIFIPGVTVTLSRPRSGIGTKRTNMICVTVKLVGVLKSLVPEELREGFRICLEGSKVSLRDVLEHLYFKSPELYARVWSKAGVTLMPDIVIFINGVDFRLLGGLDAELKDGDEVVLLAYIHGG